MLSSESPSPSSLDEGFHTPLPCFEVLPPLTSSLGSLGLFCMSLAGVNSIPFCTQSSSKHTNKQVSELQNRPELLVAEGEKNNRKQI